MEEILIFKAVLTLALMKTGYHSFYHHRNKTVNDFNVFAFCILLLILLLFIGISNYEN